MERKRIAKFNIVKSYKNRKLMWPMLSNVMKAHSRGIKKRMVHSNVVYWRIELALYEINSLESTRLDYFPHLMLVFLVLLPFSRIFQWWIFSVNLLIWWLSISAGLLDPRASFSEKFPRTKFVISLRIQG